MSVILPARMRTAARFSSISAFAINIDRSSGGQPENWGSVAGRSDGGNGYVAIEGGGKTEERRVRRGGHDRQARHGRCRAHVRRGANVGNSREDRAESGADGRLSDRQA